jgi:hypothetical protein
VDPRYQQRYGAVPTPWGTDYFNPDHIRGTLPNGPRAPSKIPEADILFDIQRDLLKANDQLRQLVHEIDPDSEAGVYYREAVRQVQNGYKLINGYLRAYTQGGQDAFKGF